MKTSNKILLWLLLVVLGYMACAQIALHIKYVNKDTTDAATYNALIFDDYAFNNIKNIKVNGLSSCDIFFADSVKLFVEKSVISYARFRVSGDTLILYGVYSGGSLADNRFYMSPQRVKLYMPAHINVYALNANIYVRGAGDSNHIHSCRFDIANSGLYTRLFYGADSLDRYFDTLSVTARNNSFVSLFKNDHFNMLNVNLDHSLINDFHAKIQQSAIAADSNSAVVLGGENITKLNSTAIKK